MITRAMRTRSTLSIFYAVVVSLVLLGAVIWPVLQNRRPEPRDGFPFSYYPMFSQAHPEVQQFTYLIGMESSGRRHYLPHRYAGSGGMNQVRRQIGRIASRGGEEADLLCRRVARALLRDQPALAARLSRVCPVTGEFRPIDYFGKGQKEPTSERVRGSHPVRITAAEDFPQRLREHVERLKWRRSKAPTELTRETLEVSLRLGRQFLVNNQRKEGNFHYEYDFVGQALSQEDNGVRQAGALWGLALLHLDHPGSDTGQALSRGLDFFLDRTCAGAGRQGLALSYPGGRRCESGMVALVGLAIIDTLRAEAGGTASMPPPRREQLEAVLDGFLRHLAALQREDGRFAEAWDPEARQASGRASPYADGEILLCMTKAARYLGRESLRPLIEKLAPKLAEFYTLESWAEAADSNLTKGFFQWGCMAFWEYREAGWEGSKVMDDAILALNWWMIHVHEVGTKSRNTAYSVEGLVQGYRVASSLGLIEVRDVLDGTIKDILSRLTTWQVGGPLRDRNVFLVQNPTRDPLAMGGVMNAKNEGTLRIDVTQHQTHALVLAMRHLYPGPEADTLRSAASP